jgi:hypothetical protein
MIESSSIMRNTEQERNTRRRRQHACHAMGKPAQMITTKPFSEWTLCLWVIVLLTLSSASSFRPFLGAAANRAPSPASKSSSSRRRLPTSYDKTMQDPHALQSSIAIGAPRTTTATWTNDVFPNLFHQEESAALSKQYQIKKTRNTPQETEEMLYQRRKEEWAKRYTNLDELRMTFGSNQNKVWGDLDATMARRLYKTLLPKALLELVKLEQSRCEGDVDHLCHIAGPEELAPLAYEARKAAKLYARERCQLPARVGAQLFDGFRQLQKYGKFQPCGMSYDQIWEKYYEQVVQEKEEAADDEVTAKICQRIIEKSCTTNEGVDKWCLESNGANCPRQDETDYLQWMEEQLEEDVRNLLLDPSPDTPASFVTPRPKAYHHPNMDRDSKLFLSQVEKPWNSLRVLVRTV